MRKSYLVLILCALAITIVLLLTACSKAGPKEQPVPQALKDLRGSKELPDPPAVSYSREVVFPPLPVITLVTFTSMSKPIPFTDLRP